MSIVNGGIETVGFPVICRGGVDFRTIAGDVDDAVAEDVTDSLRDVGCGVFTTIFAAGTSADPGISSFGFEDDVILGGSAGVTGGVTGGFT